MHQKKLKNLFYFIKFFCFSLLFVLNRSFYLLQTAHGAEGIYVDPQKGEIISDTTSPAPSSSPNSSGSQRSRSSNPHALQRTPRFIPLEDLQKEGYGRFLFRFAKQKKSEIATLAGGCFWEMENLLKKLPGVVETQVGYTGGANLNVEMVTYEDVHPGTTGHAESVQVLFDPLVTSYEAILLFFFKIHDPTSKNQQGNDRRSQYRSAIFVQVEKSKKWNQPITTEIVTLGKFWLAEEYHQNYLIKHPQGCTCHFIRKIEF